MAHQIAGIQRQRKEQGEKEGREGRCCITCHFFLTMSIPENRHLSLESSGFEQSKEGSYADV